MFVSNWEEDDVGILPKDMSDPREQFRTAAEEGNLEELQRMFKAHPEYLHAQDLDKYTALHRAAYNNHVDVCKWLLSVGADPEMRTEDGWTALHCAACWANHEVVSLLLSHGMSVNSRSNGNLTPLHLAINSAEDPIRVKTTVKVLLDAPGIDLQATSNAGDTPLMLVKRIDREMTEMIETRLSS
ncbi:ankyrin repeats (many copies) domain-containing protein [Ditylenchus destructor]|uniref:Ankyrin repeats (Many copies) domain-containing protein n=1 Tax=Ditylenchus destructor TaxID=166010 RepID=A0AAD4MK05_9BILA|nr:ankyrin repeats (many copies) domain-containing protein [Ditylenchus destructor]